MKFNDAVFGALLGALGAVVLVIVQGYPKIPGQQVGPALFPGLIAAALCACGVMLILRGWRERAAAPWALSGEWVRSRRHLGAFIAVIGSVVFYILAADKLGFLIASMVVLAVVMLAMRVRPRRAVLIAVIATLVIHFAFYKLLRVPLPWGVLTPYAW